MRNLAALLLIAGAVLAWFSLGDRMSAVALTLVELDAKAGLPLYAWCSIAGLGRRLDVGTGQ